VRLWRQKKGRSRSVGSRSGAKQIQIEGRGVRVVVVSFVRSKTGYSVQYEYNTVQHCIRKSEEILAG
jgi:hypothetical protein